MPDALSLLKTRRSVKPIELKSPAPSAAEIETILTIASRVPDHGKLTPWRFILFEGDSRTVGSLGPRCGAVSSSGRCDCSAGAATGGRSGEAFASRPVAGD